MSGGQISHDTLFGQGPGSMRCPKCEEPTTTALGRKICNDCKILERKLKRELKNSNVQGDMK